MTLIVSMGNLPGIYRTYDVYFASWGFQEENQKVCSFFWGSRGISESFIELNVVKTISCTIPSLSPSMGCMNHKKWGGLWHCFNHMFLIFHMDFSHGKDVHEVRARADVPIYEIGGWWESKEKQRQIYGIASWITYLIISLSLDRNCFSN